MTKISAVANSMDPDYYQGVRGGTSAPAQDHHDESSIRAKSLAKIRAIVEREFSIEVERKEKELAAIDHRIHLTKASLDKLRSYVLAAYFGSAKLVYPQANQTKKKKSRISIGENNGSATAQLQDHCYVTVQPILPDKEHIKSEILHNIDFDNEIKCENSDGQNEAGSEVYQPKNMSNEKGQAVNRFYYYRHIIVGNISKYIPLDKREKSDQSTHKWMVYVRGTKQNPDVSDLVKKVVFFLHPSYIPHDIVEVSQPPFHLTRRGWGEFPVRLQIHFHDKQNKAVDIIHLLKLDETYTGLQTLGCEKNIELRLHRHTVADELACVLLSDSVSFQETISTNTFVESEVISMEEHASIFYSETECKRSQSIEISALPFNDDRTQLHLKENDRKDICCDQRSFLIKAAAMFPLISPYSDDKLWFSSTSFAEYSKLPFFKRRAAEQQRAFAIKKYIRSQRNIPSHLDNYSTGKFLVWCRRNGFSPSESNGEVWKLPDDKLIDSCKLCGQYFEVKSKKHKRKHTELCQSCRSETVIPVNGSVTEWVCQTSDDQNSTVNIPHQDFLPEEIIDILGEPARPIKHGHKREIPCQPLDDWIYNTACNVNVTLDHHTYHDCKGPVLHAILSVALKCFVRDLLSSSYNAAKGSSRSLTPVCLTTLHINKGIQLIPEFDFLTNEGLGINCKTPEKG